MGLMNPLKNIWNKFIAQPDIWFFYGFLLTFTLSIRKVIKFYPINGQFNEYTGIYLYLSDIFLILALVFWGISILQNKNDILSIYRKIFSGNKFLIIIPLLLVIWSFISSGWADNKIIALFRSIKLLEFYLLYVYLIFRIVPYGTISSYGASVKHLTPTLSSLRRGGILINAFRITIFMGLFQAIIGIWQFVLQHSLELFWLKESLILPSMSGVAKIILNGEKYIRAYGLFPHPNILGGFLLFSIIITWTYWKLIKIPLNPPFTKGENGIVPHGTIRILSPFVKGRVGEGFLWTILVIQILALLLTFSKSAILGLFIALLYLYVSRGTSRISSPFVKGRIKEGFLFHMKHYWKQIAIVILIAFIGLNWLKMDWNTFFAKSWIERETYLIASFKEINDNPVTGVGMGQFVLVMGRYVPHGTYLENWQFQPVHNVFLLILSELGIIGLGLFIWWTWKLLKLSPFLKGRIKGGFLYSNSTQKSPLNPLFINGEKQSVPRGTLLLTIILKSVLIGFIFIMFFDHYFWDIQQGEVLLFLTFGLFAGFSFIKKQTMPAVN